MLAVCGGKKKVFPLLLPPSVIACSTLSQTVPQACSVFQPVPPIIHSRFSPFFAPFKKSTCHWERGRLGRMKTEVFLCDAGIRISRQFHVSQIPKFRPRPLSRFERRISTAFVSQPFPRKKCRIEDPNQHIFRRVKEQKKLTQNL